MQHRAPLIIAIVLLLLPMLYVGSYLALVNPQAGGVWDVRSGRRLWDDYRWGGEYSRRIFWPLEQLDRKLRPGSWAPDSMDHMIWID